MKTLLIDNYDSFTFNLFQLVAQINGQDPTVIQNDQAQWSDNFNHQFDNIIVSPGPGRPDRPQDFGFSLDAIKFAKVPLLGVCLGHQGIGYAFGAKIIHAAEPIHGRLSSIHHSESELFSEIPSPTRVVRYHSLILEEPLPESLVALARTSDGMLMALKHRSQPLFGVQFHPESIATEYGFQILKNFRDITARYHEPSRSYSYQPNPKIKFRHAAVTPAKYKIKSTRIDQLPNPEILFESLFGTSKNSFWLDSNTLRPGLSRFSFMGDDTGPLSEKIIYNLQENKIAIQSSSEVKTIQSSIWDYLERELKDRYVSVPETPFEFNCGYLGYFSYECNDPTSTHTSPQSACQFLFVDRFLALDHLEQKTYLLELCNSDNCFSNWTESTTKKIFELSRRAPKVDPQPNPDKSSARDEVFDQSRFVIKDNRESYLAKIQECLKLIRDGESYEICLTNKISSELKLDSFSVYRHLRNINPAPFSAFLRFENTSIACSSPERFLKISAAGQIEARPIKGTLARGKSSSEDAKKIEQLLTSEKDRSENLMIVDLLRNDLGKVCEIGTVKVPRLMEVETYATVHQLVSTVCGVLRPECSTIAAIRAAFPGGSMTGAPKIRTMEIISRLEASERGIYSGALGWLGLSGAVDLNIVIRTLVFDHHGFSLGAGGAIVALSTPEAEFEEMMLKAQAPLRAIQLAIGK